MKKIYMVILLAVTTMAMACKKEKKTNTTNASNFNIVGYWLADGKGKNIIYDKNGQITSTEEVDISAKPKNYQNGSFVNYHFKNDGTFVQTDAKYDPDLNIIGYTDYTAKYQVSKKDENTLLLTITNPSQNDHTTYLEINLL